MTLTDQTPSDIAVFVVVGVVGVGVVVGLGLVVVGLGVVGLGVGFVLVVVVVGCVYISTFRLHFVCISVCLHVCILPTSGDICYMAVH
jgi:hypothetical protein